MAFIVGITGASGSGKSTLAAALEQELGPELASAISQDHYYLDLGHIPLDGRAILNFDDPEAVELALLAEHLEGLRAGRDIERPVYDFSTHTRTRGETAQVEAKSVVIVEGLFLGYHPGISSSLDLLVFVEAPGGERFRRRLQRDLIHRGRNRASVERQWDSQVEPAAREFILPFKEKADLVVDGTQPLSKGIEAVRRLLPV